MPRKLLYSCLLLACALCERPALAANLRVVTFNAGLDRVLSLRSWSTVEDTFTRDARLGRAHLLALQELCLNQRTSLARFLQVMRLNHGVQYHFADYSNRRNGSCGKGQAIVSAYPIVAAGTLVLPRVGAHHAAIWADLRVEGPSYRRLRVYNVHLSNRQGWDLTPLEGRQRQVKAVMQHAAEFQRRFPGAPVIVLGDFNSLGKLYDPARREPAIAEVNKRFRPALTGFVPTMLLPYEVDWIFYSGLELRRGKVAHVFFSDHFPVVADFDF